MEGKKLRGRDRDSRRGGGESWPGPAISVPRLARRAYERRRLEKTRQGKGERERETETEKERGRPGRY